MLEAEVEGALAVEVGGHRLALLFHRLVLVTALASTEPTGFGIVVGIKVQVVDVDGDRGVVVGDDGLVALDCVRVAERRSTVVSSCVQCVVGRYCAPVQLGKQVLGVQSLYSISNGLLLRHISDVFLVPVFGMD